MHLFHQMISLGGIYASEQGRIVVPFVQDFFTQEKLAGHALNKLLFIVRCTGWVFIALDISLDIMVPWLSVSFDFDTYAFFDVHAIGWNATDLYEQLSHIVSF